MKKERIEKIDTIIEKTCEGISIKIDRYGPLHIEAVTEPIKALADLVSARAKLKED